MSAAVLRAASPGDAALLLRLARAFHAGDGHPLDAAGETAIGCLCRGEPLARAWLIEEAGRPLGYAVLTLGFSVELGGRDGFVDDLYLAEEARGRGIGSAVLDRLVEEARALGIGALHLEVEPGNEAAARLYRRAGFTPSRRLLMTRRLG